MTNKRDRFAFVLLEEMFKRVGVVFPRSLEDGITEYTKSDGWYLSRVWTNDQQEDFGMWAIKKIMRFYGCGKKAATVECAFFLLMYGWTTSQEAHNKYVRGEL